MATSTAKTRPRDETDAAEHYARGRKRRKTAGRSSPAHLCPEADRTDPLELLRSQDASRLPELVPIRYGRMAVSPFAFLRGAALPMADDLSKTPHSGIEVQACGDAHLSNFGLFQTPERRTAFDVNDFDETHRAPFEWDVMRLAASVVVSGRVNGISDRKCRAAALATAHAYRHAMRDSARLGHLAVWYQRIDVDALLKQIGERLDTSREKSTRAALAKARNRNSLQALRKLTTVVDGRPRFKSDPPLLVPLDEIATDRQFAKLKREMHARFDDYRRTLQSDRRLLFDAYTPVEFARKVVGVGSVGTRTLVALFRGADADDPLILQIKEAQPSVLAPYVAGPIHRSQGKRVVTGQRLLQAASDIFLGWQTGPDIEGVDRDYYVRQLRDGKGSVVVEALRPDGLALYGELCGRTLAFAHARGGNRFAIAGYLGGKANFDHAITEFADAYADRTFADHARLVEAIRDGTIEARDL
ncbi:DUF2252 domain-containing protein [Rhodococcus sp. HNM0569]|uniref:DUF2252 domain-containing protein n=1 Tax=Rhodococcus sp. HNM0569 TaxID=2716340 RepID=UPI00146EA9B6|nr:DUF2252 domain-containing protein [Rhodococcus sp. HNM0569]NLU84304.1 DUF2252 domain-containing protein [Rhodococcus sp. HNM0569]